MNHKTWLTVFGVFALLLIGGAAFYAFSGYGKYSEGLAGWDSEVGTIESLERRVPYPDKNNSEALKEKVDRYDTAVQELYEGLNSFQRPLNLSLQGTQFAQLVKKSVQEFREFAKSDGFEIESEGDFQLGFDAYSSSIPAPELVPILDYELEAIDQLLRKLVTSGVDTLLSFERDAIPGEPGGAEDHESGVVHKYPVRLRFKSNYNAFQDFINQIANDKEFFYIVRVLKVQNEVVDGPAKQDSSLDVAGGFVHAATGEEPTEQELIEWGYGSASDAEVAAAAQAAGFVSSQQDARVLMGQEKLEVYMVVDIVRFVDSTETEKSDGDESNEKGNE